MLDKLKEKAIAKGLKLLSSPVVAKAMESEKVGVILEKVMTFPITVSEKLRVHKGQVTNFMELVTKTDLDEVKSAITKMEDLLYEIKKETKAALAKSKDNNSSDEPAAE